MPGPLEGVRVLDVSRILAGPYCSMVLGDWGADVIKVERPGTGDDTRAWGPPFAGIESAYFISANRSKRSLTLDLRSEKGLAILKDLAKTSDVFLENFTPGVAARLGIDYPQIGEVNPRIVYASITGFGPDGPSAGKTGYDMVISAIGGLMSITGEEDGGPVKVGVAITDVLTGVFAAAAILAALRARDLTGRGQRIDLSLLETQVAALVNIGSNYLVAGKIPRRWGSAHESIVPYQAFETRDRYVTICVGNDRMWQDFCRAMELPDLAADPRFAQNKLRVENRRELSGLLAARFRREESREILARLEAAGVPCGPINSVDEVFADEQVLHRRMLLETDHPTIGRLRMAGLPVKFSGTPGSVRHPPPTLGQHTEEILREILGLRGDEVEGLRREGVV